MKTTIAKVTLTAMRNDIWWAIEGTVVARGCTVDAPGVLQTGNLDVSRWADVFGSEANGFKLLRTFKQVNNKGDTFTRKLRLTTLGYDRTDRVITA